MFTLGSYRIKPYGTGWQLEKLREVEKKDGTSSEEWCGLEYYPHRFETGLEKLCDLYAADTVDAEGADGIRIAVNQLRDEIEAVSRKMEKDRGKEKQGK